MWILYIALYIVFSVSFNQFYKITVKTSKNHGDVTVLLQLLASVIILILCPLFKFTWPTNYITYIFLGVACIFYAIADRLNTTVRSGIEASTFSILSQITTVFMILAGIFFFKETFVLKKIIGAALIVFSNILIFYKKGKTHFNKYVLLGILSNLSLAIALFIDVNLSSNFNLPIYVALTLSIPSLFIIIFEKLKFKNIKNEFINGNKKAIIMTSLSWGLLIVSSLRAYQLGDVTSVAPLCALTAMANVIVSYIFLKERSNLLKKIIAALLIILSVVLIKL